MCGILAFFKPGGHDDHGEAVRRATDLMAHRGPDGVGIYVEGTVALGHRRLSIIDLAGGRQPMFNEDGAVSVVFNGEIYNFKEVRGALIASGHRFATSSDTETIVHAYEEWGKECVARFNGMFAFAVWDSRKQELWVVRDRMGVKPLYLAKEGGRVAFASEIKPLRALGFGRGRNERVLDAFLSLGYVPGEETMFEGIRKIPPGHHVTVSASAFQMSRYWDFNSIPTRNLEEGAAMDQLLPLLRDCVQKCLVSDVPLGVFLSGGLDSSAVVALMHSAGVDPVNSFTVGYDGPASESELSYAQIVARKFETCHHVFTLRPADFFESLRAFVRHTEEPLVEAAGIALYRLSRLARQNVTVLLSGEGSDEVFGGYALYRSMFRIDRIRRTLPAGVWNALLPLRSLLAREKHRKYLDWMASPLEGRYQGTSSYLTPSLKERYYSDEFFAARGTYLSDVFSELFSRVEGNQDALKRMLYVDSKTWLADNLLTKADKMTMAASVELRVPFLDHRLVEFTASLPSQCFIQRDQGKWLLKRAMEKLLPAEIVWRRKLGFPVPVNRWFGDKLLARTREVALDSDAFGILNRRAMERMLREHKARREDHSRFILTLLVLSAWNEEFMT